MVVTGLKLLSGARADAQRVRGGTEKAMVEGELFFDEGYIFGQEGAGFERLNLACPARVVEKALEKLKAVAERVRK